MLKSICVALLVLQTFAGFGQSIRLFTLLNKEQTAIDFENRIEENEELNVLSYEYFYNGGGVAAGDINNDGLIDLYFTGNMVADKLYLNQGQLRFKDISKRAGIEYKHGWKTGVTMADVNADGFLDIYVCYSGNNREDERRNKLYINNRDLTFTESASEFGLDDPSYSTQASFFDYDRDGDLDMYLLNHSIEDYKEVELKYLKTTNDSLAGDRLFRNDNNFFVDVSKSSGITGNPISFGLGISVSDINSDGWLDIYVSNDYQENDYLYINQHDGTFKEMSHQMLQHMSHFSMGNDIGDLNNDALPDILSLDMLPEDNKRQKLLKDPENYELFKASVSNGFHHQYMRNMLHLNNGDGTFSEVGQIGGISNTDWSWAGLMADFDNDGWKDIYITNGYLRDYTNKDFLKYWGNYIVQKATKMEKTYLMDIVKAMPSTKNQNYFFQNNRNLTFTNNSEKVGLDQFVLSNGATYADLDNDGDLDIVTNNVNERAYVYKNNAVETGTGNFVQIQLKEANNKNPFAVGAAVKIFSEHGVQFLEQIPCRGFQSAVSSQLHSGLGDATAIDSVHVRWSSGYVESFYDLPVDKMLTLKQGEGTPINSMPSSTALLFTEDTTLLFNHRDFDYNDFKRQPLMPFMYSFVSPVIKHADINKDGFIDIFIGASKGQSSAIFIQKNDGSFEEQTINPRMYEDRYYTASDALFFDADGDEDLDLYVVSGGYHDYDSGNVLLNDRLYLNDGSGYYSMRRLVENNASSKSCVEVFDFDQDGDMDLFVGGRVIPGKFPEAPRSYLLANDGNGNFEDVTFKAAPSLAHIGMVTKAEWTDLDRDNKNELIVSGEWMPLSIFRFSSGKFSECTAEFFDKDYRGLWNTFEISDLNGDGFPELIAGNLGTNTQIKASEKEVSELVYADFDNNGSIDPFLCYYIQGVSYPDMSRDMLLEQIYPLRKKFTSYESYSTAVMSDIFSADQLSKAKVWKLNTLETTLFINDKGKFTTTELPIEAQFSPVTSIQIADVNADNLNDVVLLGNCSSFRLKYGKMDANFGTVLLNKGNAKFQTIQQKETGLKITGDVKDSAIVKVGSKNILMVGVNRGAVLSYILNEKVCEQ